MDARTMDDTAMTPNADKIAAKISNTGTFGVDPEPVPTVSTYTKARSQAIAFSQQIRNQNSTR